MPKESALKNIASERAVLAGIFSHGIDCFIDVEMLIDEDTFTLDHNKVLFKCVEDAVKKSEKIGFTEILSSAKSLGLSEYIERQDVMQHVNGVINTPIDIENVRLHAAKIRRLQFARNVQNELRDIYRGLDDISGDESITEILSIAEKPIQDICMSYTREDNNTPTKLGDSLEEYIEHVKNNKSQSIGLSTGFSIYDKAIGGGLRRKCVDLIAARPKALRDGSLVYKSTGPVKIEDVMVGDKVLHPTKGETTVTEVWPHKGVDIYRISFKDGDFVDCCEDHIWHVNLMYGGQKEQLKTTKELIDDITYGNQGRSKWSVPLPDPVEFEQQDVTIDPYALGVLLGDGSVGNNTCVYHTADEEIHTYMSSYAESLGLDVKIDSHVEGNKCTAYRINSFQYQLRESGIFGHNCYSKFVPKKYIYNTQEVRLAVLAGLLDTDGDCTIDRKTNKSRTRFGSVSLQLCEDVKEIVQSLGGLCSINKCSTKCNGKSFQSYRCEIRLPEGVNPFRLKRKKDAFTKRTNSLTKRVISSIEKVGNDNARCLTLSENDGLFMTDNYVVTHNTGKSLLADEVAMHVSKELKTPVLMLDTEMGKEDHWNRILANISGVEINDIATGAFADDPDKIDKVNQAVQEINDIPYEYISIAGKPFEETISIARRWILKNVGYDENGRLNDCLIIYDYLKLMSAASISSNLAEFQVLGFQITQLHNFCVEHDVACLAFVQLNRDGETKESTDVVSGSDRLVWLCTSFSIFKNKTEDEKAADGILNGDKKLIPIVSRHGPGMEDEGYICLKMDGEFARVTELGTIREINKNAKDEHKGIPDAEDASAEDEADDPNF